jgi:hypothetical protein
VNGGLSNDANQLVSSGFLLINGVRVVGPNNSSQNVSVIDVGAHLCRFDAFSA